MANTKRNPENVRNNIKGNWNSIKGQVKEKYGELTDDDLRYEEGQEDQLVGRIQQRTGRSEQEIEEFIDSVSQNRGGNTGNTNRDENAGNTNRDRNQNPSSRTDNQGTGPDKRS